MALETLRDKFPCKNTPRTYSPVAKKTLLQYALYTVVASAYWLLESRQIAQNVAP